MVLVLILVILQASRCLSMRHRADFLHVILRKENGFSVCRADLTLSGQVLSTEGCFKLKPLYFYATVFAHTGAISFW